MKKTIFKTTKTEFDCIPTLDDLILALTSIREQMGTGKLYVEIDAINIDNLKEEKNKLRIDCIEFDNACYQVWIRVRP